MSDTDTDVDVEERAFERGRQAAAREMLQWSSRLMGHKYKNVAALLAERAATVAALREVCADHGDNNWADDLHLADVVEKHLGRPLGAAEQEREAKS